MSKITFIIPMAGLGSRFKEAGYDKPKPFISVHSTPMIECVVKNLTPKCDHRFIFITQKEHMDNYNGRELLNRIAPDCNIIEIEGLTEGAACTVLKARDLIDSHDEIIIANSDQYVDFDINDFIKEARDKYRDGLIATMPGLGDPKWSYIVRDLDDNVCGVVEKRPISEEATVGIYYFKFGHEFLSATDTMIENNDRFNGEFYVAPIYTHFIDNQPVNVVETYKVKEMYGLGTPKDLELFKGTQISEQFK